MLGIDFGKIFDAIEKIVSYFGFVGDFFQMLWDIIIKVSKFCVTFLHFLAQCFIVVCLVIWYLFAAITDVNYLFKFICLKLAMLVKLVIELNVYAFFFVFMVFFIISSVIKFFKEGQSPFAILKASSLKIAMVSFATVLYGIIKAHIEYGSLLSILITILSWISNSIILSVYSFVMFVKAIVLFTFVLIFATIDILLFSNKFNLMRNFLYPYFFACENDNTKWASMNGFHKRNMYENGGLLRMCYSPCKEGYIPSLTSQSCDKLYDNTPYYCAVQMIKNIDNTGKINKQSFNYLKMIIDKDYNDVMDIDKYTKEINRYMNECSIKFNDYNFIGKSVCEGGDTSSQLSELCNFQYCKTGRNIGCISCLKHDKKVISSIDAIINTSYDKMKNDNFMISTFIIIVLLMVYVMGISSLLKTSESSKSVVLTNGTPKPSKV